MSNAPKIINTLKQSFSKKNSLNIARFSKLNLALFVFVFGGVGAYVLFKSFAASPPANITYGDLNGDNAVSGQDLSMLISNFAKVNAAADVNSDASVNIIDLSILLSHYGTNVPVAKVNYNAAILADSPKAFWAMNHPTGTESDLSGHNHTGTYLGGTPALTSMPNGDQVDLFNGATQHLNIPSSPDFSIPTTKELTWEAWIKPSTLDWSPANDTVNHEYIDWMGKCQALNPTCEWMARIYENVTTQGRCNRISAYAFNPAAGFGSGAFFQPTCGLLQPGQWLYVVGEYQLNTTPAGCDSAFPGTISIWVNGIEWSMSSHLPTGCMSQYSVAPTASTSPINIGTNHSDTWFPGAIGKVAIYNKLLSQQQINNHFTAMTGAQPSGSCANTCTIPVPTP